jgi:hypothetical protein
LDQLDLRGVDFDMHIRRRPPDNEVVLSASTTTNGGLSIGAPPNFGHLLFFIREPVMRNVWPGQYVGDVRASDGDFQRICLTIDLTVIEGVTR